MENQNRRPPPRGPRNNNRSSSRGGYYRNDRGGNRRPYNQQNNPPMRPVFQGDDQLVMRYIELLELHRQARKQYFEAFDNQDYYRVQSLERKFYATMDVLRSFTSTLNDGQRKALEERINPYKFDHTYSQNHQLNTVGEKNYTTIENPHLLLSQMEAKKSYAQDLEESTGSIDDYKKLKGL